MKKYLVIALICLVGCTAKVEVKSTPLPTPDTASKTIASLQEQIYSLHADIQKLQPIPVIKPKSQMKTAAAAATPQGVEVSMSDGTTQVFPLGVWIEFASGSGCSPACPTGGQLRGIFPTQYVNQIAVVQADGTWIYPHPGRNVQVWRNGVLQRLATGTPPANGDYTLNQATATLTPLPVTLDDGTVVPLWNTDDYVTVAFLF